MSYAADTTHDALIVQRMREGVPQYMIAREIGMDTRRVYVPIDRLRRQGVLPSTVKRAPKGRAAPKPEPEKIPCLRCSRDFPTKCRVNNRICEPCKGSEVWR